VGKRGEKEMNERIKELAREAGFYANPDVEKFERFAELVRQEEREACAKLCDEHAKESWDQEGGALNCADKIRGRTE
jgi:ferredoxin-thioredoxin reductase catalytic subunit